VVLLFDSDKNKGAIEALDKATEFKDDFVGSWSNEGAVFKK
jgi:hypothetical protein